MIYIVTTEFEAPHDGSIKQIACVNDTLERAIRTAENLRDQFKAAEDPNFLGASIYEAEFNQTHTPRLI
jgi:hypothetical protein